MGIENKSEIRQKVLRLTPEQIDEVNFIEFSKDAGAPFNLNMFIPPDLNKNTLFENLLKDWHNESSLLPFARWETCRKRMNPLWSIGSGFEGHLVGLPPEEMLKILEEEENFIIKVAREDKYFDSFKKFINNTDTPISLKLADSSKCAFEVILSRMRAKRSQLQEKFPQNKTFEQTINQNNKLLKTEILLKNDNLVIGLITKETEKENNFNSYYGGDIKNKFPYLAEIGRFGSPLLRILLHNLPSYYYLI